MAPEPTTPTPETTPPTPEPPAPRGRLFPGRGPRLQTAARTGAILGVLAFLGLLVYLTSQYSHDVGGKTDRQPQVAAPASPSPLSTERIEQYARERLAEQLRASQPPPAPPDFGPVGPGGGRAGATAHAPAPTPPPAPSPSPRPRSTEDRLPALHAPLTPRGGIGAASSPTGPATPGTAATNLPPLPDLSRLEERLSRTLSASTLPRAEDEQGSPGEALAPSTPRPDERRVELPDTSAEDLVAQAPGSSRRLYAATAIPLVLAQAVTTDVPGPVRAWVTRDVWDSLTHRTLLLPRGTLAIGHQSAYAASGDTRVLIAWSDLKLPSGLAYRLPELPAGSADGTAGVEGHVNEHWWSRIGHAVALSLVGAGIQLSQPQSRTAVNGFAPTDGQVLAQQLGLELGRLSQEILRRGVEQPPTITLRPGQRLTLVLTHDLVFPR